MLPARICLYDCLFYYSLGNNIQISTGYHISFAIHCLNNVDRIFRTWKRRIQLTDHAVPVVPMFPEFSLREFASSRMVIVVVFDFCMAIKAEGNAVLKAVVATKVLWFEMVRLNSNPTEFVANAA